MLLEDDRLKLTASPGASFAPKSTSTLGSLNKPTVSTISVRDGGAGDAVASPTLKNWPLFGQKISKFGQSIQLHSHVSDVVSIFQTKAK